MTNQEIKTVGQTIAQETQIGGNTAARVGGVVEGIGVALDNKDAANGYYQATISGGTITVNAPNYLLGSGGNLRIKMPAAGTTASTLTIGNANAVQLWYNGAAVSAQNTWEAGEIISVFYDGTKYMASNSQGGGGKIKIYNNNNADLDIADENGNTLVRFADGHVKTKNFDSEDIVSNIQHHNQSIKEINETIEEDLPSFKGDEIFDSGISDEHSNILMALYDGHIKTKNFDSKNVLEILNNIPQIPKCKDQSETSEYITVLNDNFQTQTNIWEESWNRQQNGTFTPQNLNQVAKTSKRFFSDKRQIKIKTTLYNDVILNIYSTNAQEASSYIIDLVNKKINLGTEEYSVPDISITNGAEHEIVISIQNFVTKVSIYNTQTNKVTEIEMFGRQDYELKGKLCLKQTQGTLISITDFSILVLKNPTILFLGDSITAGAFFRSIVKSEGMYIYHIYTKLIGNIIGDCITVAGGGEAMSAFTEMWENEIQFMSPKAISALVGTNGGFSLQQITTLMSNLLTVTQKLFVHHLFGTNTSSYRLAYYNQILEQALSQQEFSEVKSARLDIATSVEKSDDTSANITLDTDLMYDRVIHPNYEGSKAIVNRIKFDCPELFKLN